MTDSAQHSARAASSSPAANAGGGDDVAGSSFHALEDPPARRDRTWLQKLRFASGDAIYAISQRRALDFGDLLPLREVDATATCFARFHAAYERHARSLPRAMASAYGAQFALCGLGYLFVAANAAGAPVVVHHVVSAFSDAAATESGALDVRGVSAWLAVFIVLRVANVAVATQVECCVNHIALRLTAAMKSLLFRKALRRDAVADASPDCKTTKPADLTNLVTSDTNGVLYAVLAAHNAWILPLQIAVITALLYRELDVAAFAGIAVVVASLGGNYGVARVMGRAYGALMRAKDARMATVKDAFGAIQIVKFNAWEPRFHATLTAQRATEIDRLAVYSYASAAGAFVLWSSPFFVSTVSFAVYALALGRPLTAAKVFTSMALFNALRDPLRDLPTTIQSLIQSRVSLRRLERFLVAEELDERGAFRGGDDATNADATTAIRVDRASFAWRDTVVLRDVELTIQRGDLVVVHGPVGAGKSSLLSGLLGEMTTTRGSARLHGRVAYYSQQPWIQNLTVRDNILFGTRFDAASYAAVLDACCLGPDLALLVAGDATEIGEKGVNLSGGQKARVALARACYAALHGADIVLLDAPLAAVDAHVQQSIFAKCLCGLLRGKTVVLVTHSAEILASPLVNCRVEIDASGRISRVDRSATGTNMIPDDGTADVEVADEKHKDEVMLQPDAGRLVEDEGRRDGQIAGSVVQQYLRAAGGTRFVAVLLAAQLAWQGFQIGSDVWLSHWTSHEIDPSRVAYFTGVYASFAAAGATMVLLRGAVVAAMGLRAAHALFRAMTDGLLHVPLRFFDANPIGRILNRFADDMATIDVQLPAACATLLSALFSTLGALLTAAVAIQYVGLAVLPLVALYVRVAKGYVRTFCDVRRMLKVVNSPILSHLTQSEAGAPLLRAFGSDYVARALAELHVRIDVDNALWDTEIVLLQWFALRLQLLGCALVCLVVGSFVACARWFSPGLVGLAFTYALSIDGSLLTLLKAWSKAENALVSVERVAEYSDLPREGEQASGIAAVAVVVEPPASWPEHGAVVFEHVSFAYTPGGAPVLRDVSFSVRAHEKVGVVGRTGAGKSSLAMALLRVNELEAGRVLLDGRDTASVPLAALRGRIAIIPQSPVLLEGSLRHFLDPFGDYSDADVRRMLAQVEMLPALEAMARAGADVLELPLQANGENLSVGERQLLCVARALLRRCAVVVLDEATAAMDRDTETKLARMLARELRNVTQITIAHRLATVMDSDRILVMDRGFVVEYAAPATLLQDPTSAFSALVVAAKAR